MRIQLACIAVLAAVLPLATSGCSSKGRGAASAKSGAVAIDDGARKEAGDLFATRCTVCHGAEGAGNGPASAGLTPRPRNFQDRSWQGSVTNEHIEQILQYGGAAVGKSPAMPPNPDLVSRPAVVAGLREKVRSLAH